MAKGISLSVNFESLLERVQEANGDIDSAALRVAKECTKIMESELKSECSASSVPASVTSEIKANTERDASGNRYTCTVGWKMGGYNPNNLSAGYKAVFLNYGTARRSVSKEKTRVLINGQWRTVGRNRGEVAARNFIDRAKKSAKKKVKKAQEETLKEILKELEG